MAVGRNVVVTFVLFVLLALVYSPALFIEYVHHDDVLFWWTGLVPYPLHPLHHASIAIARPGAAYIMTMLGWTLGDVAGLNSIRLLNVFELAVSAFLVFRILNSRIRDSFCSLLIAATIFTLPPFEVMASWAGASALPLPMILSLLAAMAAMRVVPRFKIVAVVFLLSALLTYPPSAMMYWLAPAVLLLFPRRDSDQRAERNQMISLFWVGILSLSYYAILLKIFQRYSNKVVQGVYNPYEISLDVWGKLKWFFVEPLNNVLNLWNIYPKAVHTAVLGGSLCILYLIFLVRALRQHKGRFYLLSSGILLCVIGFSFLPNLMATSNVAFYRCLSALSAIVFLLIVAVVYHLQVESSGCRRIFPAVFLVLIFCFGAVAANRNILFYRVIPSKIEFEAVRNILKDADLDSIKVIHFQRPPRRSPYARYDEFGVLTTAYVQNSAPISLCVLIDAHRLVSPKIVTSALPGQNVDFVHHKTVWLRGDQGYKSPRRPDILEIDTNRLWGDIVRLIYR